MSGPLEHVWGVCPAQDQVWAQVSGMPPDKARRRLFMVLQAFIDESQGEGGTLVIGGHVATAESWSKLSAEWDRLLPSHGVLDIKSGKYHFKMYEMAKTPERMARVPAFYRVIEDHVLVSLSCAINANELRRARSRIYVQNVALNWGYIANPWMVGFRMLMDQFHFNRATTLAGVIPNEPVQFFFDERSEKRAIRDAWEAYVGERPIEQRPMFGNEPRFENDRDFVALQSADLWAWWVRKCVEENTMDKLHNAEFGTWSAKREKHLKFHVGTNEDLLVKMFKGFVAENIEPGRPIYDVRYDIKI